MGFTVVTACSAILHRDPFYPWAPYKIYDYCAPSLSTQPLRIGMLYKKLPPFTPCSANPSPISHTFLYWQRQASSVFLLPSPSGPVYSSHQVSGFSCYGVTHIISSAAASFHLLSSNWNVYRLAAFFCVCVLLNSWKRIKMQVWQSVSRHRCIKMHWKASGPH